MQEQPKKSNPSSDDSQIPARSGRLAGSFSLRDLEEREQRRWERLKRDSQKALFLRITIAGLVLTIAAGTFTSWRSLRSWHFQAEKNLKRIRMEMEFQQPMVLRQLPLNPESSVKDADTKRKLDDASAELHSDDLKARVQAISIVQGFLATRIPRAKAGMKSDFPSLAKTFALDLDRSQQIIEDRKSKYNQSAIQYNRTVKKFPSSLFHGPLGYPDELPILR